MKNLISASILTVIVGQANADIPSFDYCLSHLGSNGGKYIVQDFKPTSKYLGEMKVIDTFNRHVIPLNCTYNNRPIAGPIEIACLSPASQNESGKTMRVRVYHKRDENLPRLAILEVQPAGQEQSFIDRMIPLVCNQ
jgi:hypothetical protein